MQELRNKVAVITGAGSGIGRALAQAFASEGCNLALADINETGLAETAALLAHHSIKITTHTCSVADRTQMQALPAEIEAAHGAIHLLFNNAGVTINKTFEDSSLEEFEFVTNINQWGVIYGCHYFLPYLKKQSEAHIVNTSSMAAFLGLPNQTSYCMTKAAVKSFSESLRAELSHYNIGVTSIHPGTIRTNILNAAAGRSGKNAEGTQKLASLMARYGMPPEKLAVKVVKAVKTNTMQVRIGWDAVLADWLKRMLPYAIHAPLQWGFNRSLKKGG
ncbi:Short-chain dehydrogenase/reductase SDR [gamma proteobacterium HdN1]|nr:Short-chain dehydrogenase/reductase SDR [gamma proteobacterium HdN1]